MKKNLLLFAALLLILSPTALFAQNLNELFQKPLEENPEPWLQKMHYDENSFGLGRLIHLFLIT